MDIDWELYNIFCDMLRDNNPCSGCAFLREEDAGMGAYVKVCDLCTSIDERRKAVERAQKNGCKYKTTKEELVEIIKQAKEEKQSNN